MREQGDNKIKTILSLLIDITFLPQVIIAAWVCTAVFNDSYLLINTGLRLVFFIVLAEIAVLAILTAIKRFYITRFILFAAYIQLIVTTLVTGIERDLMLFGTGADNFRNTIPAKYVFFIFAGVGIYLTVINLIALYGFKKLKEKEITTDEPE